MITYIAILRGINVSGQKIIKMVELRSCLQTLAIENIQTYIQSGNIVFNSKLTDTKLLEANIRNLILDNWGFDVPIIIRKLEELRKIKKENPFIKNHDIDLTKLAVTFLSEEPTKDLIEGFSTFKDPVDKFEFNTREIYLHCPNGFGRSKLTNNFFEQKLKVACSSRNWKTLNNLIEIGEEIKGKRDNFKSIIVPVTS